MEKRRRKVSVFEEHVKNLSDVTHDLTKLILYITVVTVLGTFLIQMLGAIYMRGPMPSLPIYNPGNGAVEESEPHDWVRQDTDNEEFELDSLEKHFGLLLPKEYLEEAVQESGSQGVVEDDRRHSAPKQPLNIRSELVSVHSFILLAVIVDYCMSV